MEDVAIIGVGLHPFGRFGDKPALEMGAEAVRAACADAAVPWKDVQFAFGGSAELDTPDVVVNRLGPSSSPPTSSGPASTRSAWPSAWTSTCPGP